VASGRPGGFAQDHPLSNGKDYLKETLHLKRIHCSEKCFWNRKKDYDSLESKFDPSWKQAVLAGG
jgi:hypothetical protein